MALRTVGEISYHPGSIPVPVRDTPALPRAGHAHVPALDGVRGIAALLVLGFHFAQHFSEQASGLWVPLFRVAPLGQTGVDLFFVLSGFLITGILLRDRHRAGALPRFYVRRSLRLLPLYVGVLAIVFFVAPALGMAEPVDWGRAWYFWVYLQNLPATFHWPLQGPGHFWSLAVEEHFYLLWPLIVWQLSERALARLCGGLVLLAIAVRVALLALGYDPFYFTLARLDGLAAGSWLAVQAVRPHELARLRPLAIRGLLALTPALAVLQVLYGGQQVPALQVAKYTAFALLYAAVLLLVAQGKTAAHAVLASPPLTLLGRISYGVYVFHPFVYTWVDGHGWSLTSALAACLGGTMAVSLLSYYAYERPFLTLKQRFA